MSQFSMLIGTSSLQQPNDRKLEPLTLALKTLLPAAIEVLERRRVAGTLLYGKCAPHEEQWADQWGRAPGKTCGVTTTDDWVPLIGYLAYIKAAGLALYRLQYYQSDVALTEEQHHTVFSFVLSALDLMCAPRPLNDRAFHDEVFLLESVRDTVTKATMSCIHLDALRAAYGRLQAGGVVERSQVHRATYEEGHARLKKYVAKAQADNVARGLQSCAHCGAVETHVAQFKRCSACKGVVFCCKDCQLANWPAHKAACKAARKAAAGAAAGA
jgi:hypothetical protein